jgi:two-component system, cell cycle sensor histidine kinase and response regulator CckA
MKKFLALCLIFLLQYGFPYTLSAKTEIKVGIYNNEPLIFVDTDGKGKGIFADIIDHVAAKEGWQIDYVPGNWQECLSRLKNRQIDILCTIAFSKERDKRYDFSKENILTNWGQLYIPTTSDIKSITDVVGKKVAVLKNDIYHSAFVKLIDNFGIDCQLIEADDYHSVLALVAGEQADAGIVNRFFGLKFGATHNVHESGVVFNPIKIHYAFPQGENKAIIHTIDRYIKLLKEDNGSVYYRSLDKWLGVYSPGRAFPSWFKWAIIFALGLITFLFLGNFLLRNRIRAKTKELTTELIHREQAEKALQEAYSIINRSPAVAFLWKNLEGWPVEFVSENVRELFGYSAEEFISGQVLYLMTIHPDDLERVADELATCSNRKESTDIGHQPYRIISKDGKEKWIEDRIYIRRDKKGDITHYEGIVVDISDNMQAAEAVRKNNEKLERSKKMESLGLLAGGVAHDLNNVLSGIVSYPELLLLEMPEDNPFRKAVETIKSSGDRAVAIVQDLLTVARGVATTKEPLNLNDLIGDYLHSPEFIQLKHSFPKVQVVTNFDPNLLNMNGSHVHIRKLVMNLVSNASEAIVGSGNVVISTVNRYVDTPLSRYDDINVGEYAVLKVSDDGSGISPEDLKRIFEPFYSKKIMGRSGTGLGLAVIWNVVQDHLGYIDVASNENGTLFELFFPITREQIPGKDLSIPIKDLKGNGESILVIDDVESQRHISSLLMETLGYQTESVSSGEEAVEYLKENRVDLILLDMIMDPGIDGRETYERILKIHPNQKAIIVSGFAETDDVKQTQKLGAGKYIKKPLTIERIGLAVKEEMEK